MQECLKIFHNLFNENQRGTIRNAFIIEKQALVPVSVLLKNVVKISAKKKSLKSDFIFKTLSNRGEHFVKVFMAWHVLSPQLKNFFPRQERQTKNYGTRKKNKPKGERRERREKCKFLDDRERSAGRRSSRELPPRRDFM